MITTHQEVRMANDGEDGTNCDMFVRCFQKVSGCQFFKGSCLARKSLKFSKIYIVAALYTSFKNLLLII